MRIPLTKGKFAIVDRKDYVWLRKWNWHFSGRLGYAVRWSSRAAGKRYKIFMHKEILKTGFGDFSGKGGHRSGDTLNNRRRNLRPAFGAQNQRNSKRPKNNTTGFKGVVRYENRWQMFIRINGKRLTKCFKDPISAAKAYDEAARKYHGEFARTNFPMRFPREANNVST